MPWDPPEISTDPDEVTATILDGLASRLVGWEATEGAPEVALAEEVGREIAILNQTTAEVLQLAVAGMGETVFGFPAFTGTAASIVVELAVNTSLGDTVPDGFTVVGVNGDGTDVAFELADAIVVSPGTTTLDVTMHAAEAGSDGNGVPAGTLVVVTATSLVLAATATTSSSGGVEPESLEQYLERLTSYLGTLRPGGVRAADLAALARSVPGVERALGVDLFDPSTPGTPQERTATVFPIGIDGMPVDPTVAAQVQAVLEEAREVNFVLHVAEPTYTALSITYTAVAESGADGVILQASINNAIADWLLAWGATADDPQSWVDTTTVRYLELARVAGGVDGVAYLSNLEVNGSTGDVTIPGPAALPAPITHPTTPSTIAGSIT